MGALELVLFFELAGHLQVGFVLLHEGCVLGG